MENPQDRGRSSHDAVDLAQLWLILRQRYRFVLLVAGLVFVGVCAVTLVSRMDFRASGRLYLGELEGKTKAATAGSSEFDFTGGGQGEVGSEIEIVRSRSLVTRAILESGQNVLILPADAGPLRYWRWLASRRDARLLDAGVRELRAKDAVLADRSDDIEAYRVRFVDAEDYEVWVENSLVGRGTLGQPFKTARMSVTFLPGFERKPRAGSAYDVSIRPLAAATDQVLKVLDVSAPKQVPGGDPVNVVTLEFVESSPYLAATFLEQLMVAYLKERQTWKTEDATAAEAFVTKQLGNMRESLDQVEKKLADYRTKNRVVVLDNEAKAMIEQIGKYEEQRVANRLQVAALADIKRALKAPNPPLGAFLLGEAEDTVLEGMANSLSDARHKLTELETRFSEAAPDVRKQRAQVDAELEAVRNYVSSRLSRAQESLGTMNTIIGQFEERLKTVPGAELGLAQLARESEVYGKTYSYLLERQQQAAIIKASTLSKNRVLDAPEVPVRESSPKLPLRLLSGVFGLALGALIVIAGSFLASTFQSAAEARRSFGALPVLAIVPRRPKPRALRYVEATRELDATGPTGAFLESFRTLRTNLYARALRGGGTVLITSPSPLDGKTTCARGLAAALAADGKRVLVLDADLRKAESNGQAWGLGEVLARECSFRDAVREVQTPFGVFFAVESSGPAEPELLSHATLAPVLAEARGTFDFVLIDAPSYPLVSDALVLAQAADLVISIIRPENTPRRLAAEHVAGLSEVPAQHALVVNDAGPGARPTADRFKAAGASRSSTIDTSSAREGALGATPAPSRLGVG